MQKYKMCVHGYGSCEYKWNSQCASKIIALHYLKTVKACSVFPSTFTNNIHQHALSSNRLSIHLKSFSAFVAKLKPAASLIPGNFSFHSYFLTSNPISTLLFNPLYLKLFEFESIWD